MSNIQININTDNAAFCDDPSETSRILDNLACDLKHFDTWNISNLPHKITLRDINGNTVGECKITENQ